MPIPQEQAGVRVPAGEIGPVTIHHAVQSLEISHDHCSRQSGCGRPSVEQAIHRYLYCREGHSDVAPVKHHAGGHTLRGTTRKHAFLTGDSTPPAGLIC